MQDLLDELGALALASRLKRLSDRLLQDGALIYQRLDVEFEPRWFPVFTYLHQRGPTSITALAKGLGVSHPGVNKTANELVALKLVAPYRDRRDKRKRVLALTQLGRLKYKELEPAWRDIRQVLQEAIDDSGGALLTQLSAFEAALSRDSFVNRYESRSQLGKDQQDVRIVSFEAQYAAAFKSLNLAWIERFFAVEAEDQLVLSDPATEIVGRGGDVFFAVDALSDRVLGTCALLRLDAKRAELAKMAVAVEAQGRHIGQQLLEKVVQVARAAGYETLCLESNRQLVPAIRLYQKSGFIERPFPHMSEYQRADIYMEMSLSADSSID